MTSFSVSLIKVLEKEIGFEKCFKGMRIQRIFSYAHVSFTVHCNMLEVRRRRTLPTQDVYRKDYWERHTSWCVLLLIIECAQNELMLQISIRSRRANGELLVTRRIPHDSQFVPCRCIVSRCSISLYPPLWHKK